MCITHCYFFMANTENGFCDAEIAFSVELGELYYWPETFVNDTALVNCDPLTNSITGRKRVAIFTQASRACTGPSLWDVPDFTECVNCGSLPNPENGLVSYNSTELGAVATYTCVTAGYELVGPATRVCEGPYADFGWSGEEPSCQCKWTTFLLYRFPCIE